MPITLLARQQVRYQDLGVIPYADAWRLQTELNEALKSAKREGRSDVVHELLFCEHPPVYTLGKSGTEEHLQISEVDRVEKEIAFFRINRGGDITYHGPGQIVGYPIFDLDFFFTDVHRYVRSLEEVVIRTLSEYGLHAGRIPEFTGVWLDWDQSRPRKICAIGVHMSRWVTMHGFAFNVNTDLSYYQHIVPCGIDTSQKPVTSMAQELGKEIALDEVKAHLKRYFAEVFDFDYV
jgi:lipoyl(octanoyl) transferase